MKCKLCGKSTTSITQWCRKCDSWHASYDNISRLCRWLVTKRNFDVDAVLGYIEKPWHYRDEWAAMVDEEGG